MADNKILAADDSRTIRKAIEITFAKSSFAVAFAESGQAALEKIKTFQPSVVLVDHRMLPPDGYELCNRIKTDPATRHIQVALLFGSKQPFDENKAKLADARLAKPFDTQADRKSVV
jgi:CheY-like chemotaxis protein